MNCNTVVLCQDCVLSCDNKELTQSTVKGWISPDNLEVVVRLKHAGLRVVIAGNNPAIVDYDAFFSTYDGLTRQLGELGVRLDGIFFCSTVDTASRNLRTPEAELLTDILRRYSLEPRHCVLIGYCPGAIKAATAMNVPVIAIQGLDAALDESRLRSEGIRLVGDLSEATSHILP